jgi:Helicase associated domain
MNAREIAWERRLAALRRYAAIEGTAGVPIRARADCVDVGAWAAAQSAAYAAGTLPARNAALLETIPGWTWKTDHNQQGPPLTKLRPAANGGSLLGLAGSVTGSLDGKDADDVVVGVLGWPRVILE